jgi:hypothetical protein
MNKKEGIQIALTHDMIFEMEQIENWIFRDGKKEYKFNKEEFIKRFCLEEKQQEEKE